MFTINIKGERATKMIEWVKLTIIFYKRGYNRVTKVLSIRGLYKDWDQKNQRFVENSKENIEKNKLLHKELLKYLKIGEKWEVENKDWIPLELAHYYDQQAHSKNQYSTISEIIGLQFDKFTKQERYVNGKIIYSLKTAKQYKYLEQSMQKFCQEKYHRSFSKYMFRDITEKFLRDYILYEQKRGSKKRNNGGINQKLKTLHAVCVTAKKMKVFNVNLLAFSTIKNKLRSPKTIPKSVPHKYIQQIEGFDRALLTDKESFYLDLYLFSYYAAGISPIDICFLTKDNIKGDMLIYDRTKSDKQARVILIDKAKKLLGKYVNAGYMNYVFPIFKKRNLTQKQLYNRSTRISTMVNKTLHKICQKLKITQNVVWSSARSSYISKMIDEGYHPLVVADQTGNTLQTILRYYYTINDKEEMKKTLDTIF